MGRRPTVLTAAAGCAALAVLTTLSWADAASAQTRPGATQDNSVYCQHSPPMAPRPGPQGYGRTGTQNPFDPACARQPPAQAPPQVATVERVVDLVSVGWISEHPNPFDAVPIYGGGVVGPMQVFMYHPDWVVKVYLGLIGTANSTPPLRLDVASFRSKRDHRSVMHARIVLSVNAQTGAPVNASVQSADAPDPGWTPPFSMARFPPTAVSWVLQLFDRSQAALQDPKPYPAEHGRLSGFVTRQHPNSVLQFDAGERVLVDGVIRFRAGAHTDTVGVDIGSPYHVPWMWSEIALTYANGRYWLRGAASAFPTIWWYLNGALVHCQPRAADSSFPLSGGVAGVGATIDLSRLAVGPALTMGAPARGPGGTLLPQSPDSSVAGPVSRAPYTVGPGASGPWRRALDEPAVSVQPQGPGC